MIKHKILLSCVIVPISMNALANSENEVSKERYTSFSIEKFDWVETVDFQEDDFVSESGPRINWERGTNNNRRQDTGKLESISHTLNLGYVDYSGGSQEHNIDDLSSKTLYLGHDSKIGHGYRQFIADKHSLDIKGYLGIRLWNRAILNRDVYSNTENKEVEVGSYEFYIEGYAEASVGYNYHYNHNHQLSLSIGTDYPLETFEYSNNTNKLLYPEPTFSLKSSLTYYFNEQFIKLYHTDGKYDKSSSNSEGWFQPDIDYEITGIEYGWHF